MGTTNLPKVLEKGVVMGFRGQLENAKAISHLFRSKTLVQDGGSHVSAHLHQALALQYGKPGRVSVIMSVRSHCRTR